jgi:hypothetical protein
VKDIQLQGVPFLPPSARLDDEGGVNSIHFLPMTTYLVKTLLIVYVVIAVVAVLILWRNASAPDALKNVGIVFASVLAVVLSVLSYIGPEKIERRFTYLLLCDGKTKQITLGIENNAYESAYRMMFSNVSKIPSFISVDGYGELMGNKGFDLIEKGIIESMLLQFQMVWDVVPNQLSGPGMTGMEFAGGPGKGKTVVTTETIRTIFKHNRLISTPEVILVPELLLPPDTTIETAQSEASRIIRIINPMLNVEIKITFVMGGVQQQGIWGVQPADSSDMNRYQGVLFRVSLVGSFDSTRSHSPEMVGYRRWFENVSTILQRFDWEKVDSDIFKQKNREAISKVLDQ